MKEQTATGTIHIYGSREERLKCRPRTVSYTHLDVYKRQLLDGRHLKHYEFK